MKLRPDPDVTSVPRNREYREGVPSQYHVICMKVKVRLWALCDSQGVPPEGSSGKLTTTFTSLDLSPGSGSSLYQV